MAVEEEQTAGKFNEAVSRFFLYLSSIALHLTSQVLAVRLLGLSL